MIKKIFLNSMISLSLFCTNVHATESVFVGKVITLESTYMPGSISFQLNVGSPSCPAGSWLFWRNADPINMKITYATLLMALSSGKSVRIYVDNKCVGEYLHVLK